MRGVVKTIFRFTMHDMKHLVSVSFLKRMKASMIFLIRYALSHPAISSLVIGTKNIEPMLDDIKAVEKGKLSDEVYAEAKRRLNFAGVFAGPTDMKFDW